MGETATVITGGHGFLGWHLACRLRALEGVEPQRWGRSDLEASPELELDLVYHLAGVNRAQSAAEVERGNLDAARALAAAIERQARPVHVVYANSIQVDGDSAYARGKRAAADLLAEAVDRRGGTLADVVLPNIFGEHGRPSYNSFVATFAHAVAHGETPTVMQDREVPLLHAQRAAEQLRQAARSRRSQVVRATTPCLTVSEVLERLRGYHAMYALRGELPDLHDDFDVDLFNTYRSYLFPQAFPMTVSPHDDSRGRLFETTRSHGGESQSFVSTTLPGASRGDHYHLNKVERFFVLRGEAEIQLRRLLHEDVVRFRLSGDSPSFVDMPTLWTHSITNVGDSELVTFFWADQLLDPDSPDQYPERVEVAAT